MISGKPLDKVLARYNTAYDYIMVNSSAVQSLMEYYNKLISPGAKYKPEVYMIANYENVAKLEELREMADIICIRKMYLKVKADDTFGAYFLLQQHINAIRSKFEYYDVRFKFEDYKWRAKLYYNLAMMLMEAYENRPGLYNLEGQIPLPVVVNVTNNLRY
jgi:hypothetical protein